MAGVRLESTTVFPNHASNNIKKKAVKASNGIFLFSFQNFDAP